MTIAALQSSVESWMERAFDDALFLTFANAVAGKLTNGVMMQDGRTWIVPPLRVRALLTAGVLSVTDGVAALPADWQEFTRVWVDQNDGQDVLYRPLTQFRTEAAAHETGWPARFYALDGAALLTAPAGTGDLQVSYVTALGGFTGDASTDVVLASRPDLYRAGCIAEACGWVGDHEREDRENAKFGALVRAWNAQDRQAQHGGSLLVMRPQSVS